MIVSSMIQTQVADRIATLTFQRPEKLNALSQELISDSIAALRAWTTDPNVGYAIASTEVISKLKKAETRTSKVSTQGCAR